MRKLFLLLFGLLIMAYGMVWVRTNMQRQSEAEAAQSLPIREEDSGVERAASPLAPAMPDPVAEETPVGTISEEQEMNETENDSAQSDQMTDLEMMTLFDFDGAELPWFTVNDDVMGGVSSSVVAVNTDQQQLSFNGNLSLENNGGFASTRSQWTEYDLTGYDGIVLRVRGDGKVIQVRIRGEETGPDVAYAAAFQTKPNEWQEVYIPFAEMVPTFRGFVVRDAGPLNPATIRSFGLMITDKQVGEFALDVDWIKAVSVE